MKANFFLTVAACFVVMAGTPIPSGYEVGDTVSKFKLKNFDGKMVALADYQNEKGVILIFDCNTCPYSKAYNDRIISLHRNFGPKGFPVVTINSNDGEQSPGDSFAEMAAKARKKKYDFPYLLDDTQEVASAFGATNTPHVFVLERKGGNFVVAYIGAIDDNPRNGSMANKRYVEDAVNALLTGTDVPTRKTKAVGCGIKWKDV